MYYITRFHRQKEQWWTKKDKKKLLVLWIWWHFLMHLLLHTRSMDPTQKQRCARFPGNGKMFSNGSSIFFISLSKFCSSSRPSPDIFSDSPAPPPQIIKTSPPLSFQYSFPFTRFGSPFFTQNRPILCLICHSKYPNKHLLYFLSQKHVLCIRCILYSVKKCGSFLPLKSADLDNMYSSSTKKKVYNMFFAIGSDILGSQRPSILCATQPFWPCYLHESLSHENATLQGQISLFRRLIFY